MLQVMDKVAASLGLRINGSKTEILSIDNYWKEGDVQLLFAARTRAGGDHDQ